MKILVGCASRNTNVEAYNELARKIANFIVTEKHSFVFGGCDNGLMGQIYRIVNNANGTIYAEGVKAYEDEILSLKANSKNPNLKIEIHNTIHERTDAIIRNSDVLIFITGGIGSIFELFTAIETRRAGEHNKPIFIVNEKGYYDDMLHMLETVYNQGFASISNKDTYSVCNSFEELEKELKNIQKNMI